MLLAYLWRSKMPYRPILIFAVLFFFKSPVKAQKNTSYFDSLGRLTYVETAHHFRRDTDTTNFYVSFYAKNKKKYFEGSMLNVNDTVDYNNKYVGLCTWYYLNGNKKQQLQYDANGYLNGLSR